MSPALEYSTKVDVGANTKTQIKTAACSAGYISRQRAYLSIVVDGGGSNDRAATALQDQFRESFERVAGANLKEALQQALSSVWSSPRAEMPVSLTAVAIRGRQIGFIHTGTNRVYLIRGKAELKVLAKPHPAYVGQGAVPNACISDDQLSPGESVIILSQGLEQLSPEEIIQGVYQQPAAKAAIYLYSYASGKNASDTLAVTVFYAPPAWTARLNRGVVLAVGGVILLALAALFVRITPPPSRPLPTLSPLPADAGQMAVVFGDGRQAVYGPSDLVSTAAFTAVLTLQGEGQTQICLDTQSTLRLSRLAAGTEPALLDLSQGSVFVQAPASDRRFVLRLTQPVTASLELAASTSGAMLVSALPGKPPTFYCWEACRLLTPAGEELLLRKQGAKLNPEQNWRVSLLPLDRAPACFQP